MITEDTVSSEEVVIEAPIELVWEVLVDFAGYGAWNSFCPQAVAVLAPGEPIRMQVDLGFGLQEQVETICRIEPPTVIAWRMDNRPGDPIHAVRTQTLTELGAARCSYLSVDEFGGPGMAEMMGALGAAVEAGFKRCARDLKNHCEALYRARTGEA
jgi:uncharacterized protein YndB with AHSA1/START domain